MRVPSVSFLLAVISCGVVACSIAACAGDSPSPDPQNPPGASGPRTEGGPGPAGPPGQEGGGAPTAAWIGAGPSTSIELKLKGLPDPLTGDPPMVRVDFMTKSDNNRYKIKAQAQVHGLAATVPVPSASEDPIWIFAWTDKAGDGPDASDLVCFVPEPIVLSTNPLSLELVFTTGVTAPDVSEGGPTPDANAAAGAEPPPPGGAPPASDVQRPPPAGDAAPLQGGGAPPHGDPASPPPAVEGTPGSGPGGAAPSIIGSPTLPEASEPVGPGSASPSPK